MVLPLPEHSVILVPMYVSIIRASYQSPLNLFSSPGHSKFGHLLLPVHLNGFPEPLVDHPVCHRKLDWGDRPPSKCEPA
jgi:hypothetical protein